MKKQQKRQPMSLPKVDHSLNPVVGLHPKMHGSTMKTFLASAKRQKQGVEGDRVPPKKQSYSQLEIWGEVELEDFTAALMFPEEGEHGVLKH